jgi:hypothetical protein
MFQGFSNPSQPTVDELLEQCRGWAEEEGHSLSGLGLSEEEVSKIEAANIQKHYAPSQDHGFGEVEGYAPDEVGDGLRSCYSMGFRGSIH